MSLAGVARYEYLVTFSMETQLFCFLVFSELHWKSLTCNLPCLLEKGN